MNVFAAIRSATTSSSRKFLFQALINLYILLAQPWKRWWSEIREGAESLLKDRTGNVNADVKMATVKWAEEMGKK